jgi:hypothetical protein
MRDQHYRTQNSTKIVQPRGNVNGIIFLQTCVAQNIFAQHDWSWMGKLVLHKTFLLNVIDRELAP